MKAQMDEFEEELVKTAIRGFGRTIILWLLSRRTMSGYSITKEMRRLTGLNLAAGVVYPLLYDLEASGLIEGRWMEKGGRRIKFYAITDAGRSLLSRVRGLLEMPVKEVLKDLISQP
ncbi:MAG: PadR family transcriptional regulator [Nitrososphaerota archaeon]|nr:PadR family transcriptional regulator [Candidatus Bathyarchaeota archaeon]MDW8193604.1 PadR family transcriptional regulator [Nitrososphaerota archaeon]